MYLIDTSVWIDHLRAADPVLNDVLQAGLVCSHPFVIGELALGSLKDRAQVLFHLSRFPLLPVARDTDVLSMIETHQLFSRGMGYIDAHLLAAAKIDGRSRILTHDKRFKTIAEKLGVAANHTN